MLVQIPNLLNKNNQEIKCQLLSAIVLFIHPAQWEGNGATTADFSSCEVFLQTVLTNMCGLVLIKINEPLRLLIQPCSSLTPVPSSPATDFNVLLIRIDFILLLIRFICLAVLLLSFLGVVNFLLLLGLVHGEKFLRH